MVIKDNVEINSWLTIWRHVGGDGGSRPERFSGSAWTLPHPEAGHQKEPVITGAERTREKRKSRCIWLLALF